MTKLINLHTFFTQLSGADTNLQQLMILWITIMVSAAMTCFLVSEITRNYSQVDKLWSLMPIVYSSISCIFFPSPRLLIMGVMVSLWGLRLSFNFYRKGGYNIIPWKGEEDYRWKIMQQNPFLKGRFRFALFNLFFISFYQHLLILLFSTPLLLAAQYRRISLNYLDLLGASLMLLFLIIETLADNQQFRFQSMKRQKSDPGDQYTESLKNGFLSEGIWRYVRHPNFISEQAIWLSFYLFGVAASGRLFNWTLTGGILLILLFIGSTELTERISSEKYPAYTIYKKLVPKFIPGFFSKPKLPWLDL